MKRTSLSSTQSSSTDNKSSLSPIVALAGGVGGARMVDGLSQAVPADELSVIVNVGDDFDHLGLRICPDLDTVCYTLAGLANPATGWGRKEDTFHAYNTLSYLGGPDWFHLGDHDLGLHLARTNHLQTGQPLSQVTQDICHAWGIKTKVFPVTDDNVPTWVYTDEGELAFQEYFVHRQCRPSVTGFRFANAEKAKPAPGVLAAIQQARLVVICPSNPWVSLDPILAIPGVRQTLDIYKKGHQLRVVGISPILGGKTIKGPAAKMYAELGIQPSALSVARHYSELLDGFIIDQQDRQLSEAIEALGMRVLVTQTIMFSTEERRRLATDVLRFASDLIESTT